jgi:hypothetical protein
MVVRVYRILKAMLPEVSYVKMILRLSLLCIIPVLLHTHSSALAFIVTRENQELQKLTWQR